MLIKSEVHLLSHLRGKQHETAIGGRELSEEERNSINLKNIVDAPEGEADPRLLAAKERVKAAKRRAKKVSPVPQSPQHYLLSGESENGHKSSRVGVKGTTSKQAP